MVKNTLLFKGSKGVLPYPPEPANGPYLKPDKWSLPPPILYL